MKILNFLLVCGLLFITLTGCDLGNGTTAAPSPVPNAESTSVPTTPSKPSDSWAWKKIGKGQLDTFHIKDGVILYPEPITYKGFPGKDFTSGTTTAYFIRASDEQFSSPDSFEITMKPLAFGTGFTVKDQLFSADGKSIKMASGDLVRGDEDQKNLWLISNDGSVKSILSTKGYDELDLKVKADAANSGESKYRLNWSSDPHPMVDGIKIAFVSNRNGILSKNRGNSVFLVNKDGSNEKLLIDSQKYGNLTIVGTAKDLAAAQNDKNSLIIVNATSGEIKEFPINGMSIAISPDGTKVLFRKVAEASVQKDLWLLDVKSGKETIVDGFPQGYFFNLAGEWSPDSAKYAFYGNGIEVTDKTKGYRDNNILLVIDSASSTMSLYGKPEGTASIYPLGTNHWIDSQHVLVYLDDDTTWIAKLKAD
ncbi:hypothetical protein [Paenibacillus thalictri]|uniref:WD40 repeat domain-containing protein n=1 Tax=Paenibacillus thalictri TaxID=2527873 RepID=A0A4Q9DDZ1_9BACL|nr:hypothetical protein [Paenibacillus thalictri]TBL67981.1 hypothetical protein EYB31_38895 [Paenibacillus thalictri]